MNIFYVTSHIVSFLIKLINKGLFDIRKTFLFVITKLAHCFLYCFKDYAQKKVKVFLTLATHN